MTTRSILKIAAIAILAVTAMPAMAQIFDNPSNLKVLPEDTDPGTLRNTMRGFALATGLRCNDCHVAEEGKPMPEWDFANDEKALKKKARTMLKMVNEINSTHLGQYGEDRVRVQCVTCHRGVSKPRQIGEELTLAADEGGVEGLEKRYTEMREQYYGSASYDFSDFTVSEVARSFGEGGKMSEAAVVLDLMLKDDPDSLSAHFIYGELKRSTGDTAGALVHYKKALKINPEAGFIARRIDEIEAQSTRAQ